MGVEVREHAGELLGAVRRLARQIDAVPLRDRGGELPPAQIGELRAALAGMTDEALACCTRLFGLYLSRADAPPAADEANVSRRLDALVDANDMATHVADIVFMGCWEIKQKHAELTDPADLTPDEVLARCTSARRRTLKALCAVEMAVCDCDGLTSELATMYRSELDCALAVRRAFAAFRHAITGTASAAQTPLAQLRGIGVAVARLIGTDGYLYTRAEDRELVDELQRRVLTWLRTADQLAEPRAAADDIRRFARYVVDHLAQVNNRVELLEHDRNVANAVLDTFFTGGDHAPLPTEALAKLRPLRGRDEDIDALLADSARGAGAWRSALSALLAPRSEPEPRWSSSRKIYLRGRNRR